MVRSLLVWLAVTAATTSGALIASSSLHAARSTAAPVQFSDLLVALCAAGLFLALTWLWIVTTVTVGELLYGRRRTGGGATRRLVLLACGAALLAGATAPATAADNDGPSTLAGLSLPDRSVAAPRAPDENAGRDRVPRPSVAVATPRRDRVHVVRPGDSLWSIAAAEAGTGDIGTRWRTIWAANQDTIGSDPDLIIPGQQLRIPTPPLTEEGAR